MSFEELVESLEAAWEQEAADELLAEVGDRIRVEQARTGLVQRLGQVVGCAVTVAAGGQLVRGTLRGVGPDWILVREASEGTGGYGLRAEGVGEVLVPLAAVSWLEGLGRRAVAADATGVVAQRTALATILRRLVRDRAPVVVVLAGQVALTGVFDRVGADFAELAVVGPGESRRAAAVRGVRAIPLGALRLVRRA